MKTHFRAEWLGFILAGAAALALPSRGWAADEAALRDQMDAARDSRDWAAEGEAAQQLMAIDPKNWTYARGLAESQFHAQQFEEATQSYKKAVELAAALSDDKTRKAVSDMLIDEGDCFMKLRRFQDAVEAYDKAAPASADPARVYFNICLVEYNHGMKDGALEFADKTIKADPKNADAYYIKGSVLAAKTAWDDAQQKYVIPAGTLEALKAYLSLKPNGARAEEVRNTIKMLVDQQ